MFSEGIRLRHSSPRHLSWEATVSCIRLIMDGKVIVEGDNCFLVEEECWRALLD